MVKKLIEEIEKIEEIEQIEQIEEIEQIEQIEEIEQIEKNIDALIKTRKMWLTSIIKYNFIKNYKIIKL